MARNPLAAIPYADTPRADADSTTEPTLAASNQQAVTAAGLAVAPGDVLIARGCEHEAVFAEATLAAAAAPHPLRHGVLGYKLPHVEHDFIAFMQRSRTAFFAYGVYLSTVRVVTLAVNSPMKSSTVEVAALLLSIAGGVLMTDRVSVRLQHTRFASLVLSRTTRSRIFEHLVAVLIILTVFGTDAIEARNADLIFCPGTNFTALGKLPPFPSEGRLAAAARNGHCIMDSVGEHGMMVIVTMMVSGRVAVHGVWLVCYCILSVVATTTAAVGTLFGVPSDFYNVDAAELVVRALNTVTMTSISVLCMYTFERRTRARFQAAVAAAVGVLECERIAAHSRALASLVVSRFELVVPSNSSGGAATRFVAMHCTLQNFHRMPKDTEDDWIARFEALRHILLLADAPAEMTVWVSSGNTISAILPVPDTSSLGGVTQEEQHSACGETAGSCDAEEDALGDSCADLCRFASRLTDAVQRSAAAFPTLRAAKVRACAAVASSHAVPDGTNFEKLGATGSGVGLTGTPSTGKGNIEGCAASVSDALRRAASMGGVAAAGGSGLAVCETTWAAVRSMFSLQGMITDSTDTYHVLGPETQPETAQAVERPAVLDSLCAIAECTDGYSASGLVAATRLDARLAETSFCGCCEGRVACMASGCRAVFPRFADDGIESDFVGYDDAQTAMQAYVATVITALGCAVLLVYVSIDPYPRESGALATAVLLACAGIACSGLAFLALRCLMRTSVPSTLRGGLFVVLFVLNWGPWMHTMQGTNGAFPLATSSYTSGMVTFAMIPLLPQHAAVRYTVLFAVILVEVVTVGPSAGHQHNIDAVHLFFVIALLIAILHTRRNRAEFAVAHYMSQVQNELDDARAAMDAALQQSMPSAYIAHLRQHADGPVRRPYWRPAVTVLALSTRGSAAGFEAELHSLAAALTNAVVQLYGDVVVACAGDDRLLPPQHPQDSEVDTVRQILVKVFGPQPRLAPTHAYSVTAFPTDTKATVRAGLHRGPVVMGLLGAARCSFALLGPAADGAVALCRTSIALGQLVVSADADWSLRHTDEVAGVGGVATLSLEERAQRCDRRPSAPLLRRPSVNA